MVKTEMRSLVERLVIIVVVLMSAAVSVSANTTPAAGGLTTTPPRRPGAAVAGTPSTSVVTSAKSTTMPPLIKQTVSTSVHIRFNCQRPRTTCSGVNSTCSADDGRCHCQYGHQGFDCSLRTESIISACDPPCLNGGSCYEQPMTGSDANNDVIPWGVTPHAPQRRYLCYCTEAYHGDSCELERVYHKCNPDSMEMFVTPIVGAGDQFAGSVYVLGHEDDSRCVFERRHHHHRHQHRDTVVTSDITTSMFHRLIRFTDCGGATNHTDTTSGVTSLSWRVVVRYDDVLLETDQELTFTCYLRRPGATYNWHAFMLAHENVLSKLPSRTLTSDVQPVHMELQTVDGRPVDGPQQLGTSLQLRYTLNGGNVYDSFRVDRVAVSNAMSGDKRHAVDLVTAGCVTQDALRVKKIVQSMFHEENSTSMTLNFKVFKLRFSSQLVFENVIKACRSSADCKPPDCKLHEGGSRKRREVDELSADDGSQTEVFENTTATLTVWYPDALYYDAANRRHNWLGKSGNGLPNDDDVHHSACLPVYVVLAAVGAMVVAMLVAVVVLGVVCWRRLRKT